ncbi:MAG TPA: tetratricopeptide repeat protein [Flavobacteriales bacterium]|nr:tetratricopeptide repeat protein [Flavobacteriales bacterium]
MRKSELRLVLGGLLVLFSVVFVYWDHFDNGFHFDDSHTIVTNVYIRDIGNFIEFFTNPETKSSLPTNRQYRPLLTLSYAVDYWLGEGLVPFYFQLTTFLGYLVQLILMYFLFIHLFNLGKAHKWNRYFALFAVGWYGLHTANAETINYVCARSDSFSTLFIILGLLIYIMGKGYKKYLFILPLAAGMLIKPTSAMFAPILIVYSFLFEHNFSFKNYFTQKGPILLRSWLVGAFALGVSGALFLLVSFMTPKTWIPGGNSWVDYLTTQPWVILHYFKTFFLPTQLSADTDWGIISDVIDIRVISGLLFIVLMGVLAFATSKKENLQPIGFGVLWFFLALIPSSSVIPLAEVINDHRVFFPYVGLVFAVVYTMAIFVYRFQLFSNKYIALLLFGVGAFILVANGYGTIKRNEVWKTDESLWYDVTIKSPKNGRGLMNYGLAQMKKGDYEKALKYYEMALKLNPYYNYLHINLGVLHAAMDQPLKADRYFRKAINYGKGNPESYYFYGNFLFERKENSKAEKMYQESIHLNSGHINARHNLMKLYASISQWGKLEGICNQTLGLIASDTFASEYLLLSQNQKSRLHLPIETLVKVPSPDNFLNLSLEFYQAGLFEKCIESCYQAIKLKPDFPEAYNNICSAYNQLKQWDNAIMACSKALQQKPNYELAKNNFDWAVAQRDQ